MGTGVTGIMRWAIATAKWSRVWVAICVESIGRSQESGTGRTIRIWALGPPCPGTRIQVSIQSKRHLYIDYEAPTVTGAPFKFIVSPQRGQQVKVMKGNFCGHHHLKREIGHQSFFEQAKNSIAEAMSLRPQQDCLVLGSCLGPNRINPDVTFPGKFKDPTVLTLVG